MLNVIRQ